jgi:hypothetical protein
MGQSAPPLFLTGSDIYIISKIQKELAETTFRRKVSLKDLISNRDLNKEKN